MTHSFGVISRTFKCKMYWPQIAVVQKNDKYQVGKGGAPGNEKSTPCKKIQHRKQIWSENGSKYRGGRLVGTDKASEPRTKSRPPSAHSRPLTTGVATTTDREKIVFVRQRKVKFLLCLPDSDQPMWKAHLNSLIANRKGLANKKTH